MMHSRRLSFVPALLAAVLIFAASGTAQIKTAFDKTAANILTIAEYDPDPKIPIEPLTGSPGTTTLVRNRAKTYRAYVLCIPSEKAGRCYDRVFFTNVKTKTTYMVTGETDGVEAGRPVDELKWLDNNRLSYQRWVSPHYGHRYVINAKLRKQVAAYIVADPVKGN
jgi:hypothetical protein